MGRPTAPRGSRPGGCFACGLRASQPRHPPSTYGAVTICCFEFPSSLLIAASCHRLKVAACILLYPSTPLPARARTTPLRLPHHRSRLSLLANPVHRACVRAARPAPAGPCCPPPLLRPLTASPSHLSTGLLWISSRAFFHPLGFIFKKKAKHIFKSHTRHSEMLLDNRKVTKQQAALGQPGKDPGPGPAPASLGEHPRCAGGKYPRAVFA